MLLLQGITASSYPRFLPFPPAQAISNIFRTKKACSLNSHPICPLLAKSKKSSIWVASKRVPVETEEDVWEDADDGSGSEYEEEDWGSQSDYEEERKATLTVDNAKTAKSIYDEFVKEVELLLEPEEKAIIRQNEAPVLSKISTAKWSPFHSLGLSGQIPFMDKLLEYGVDIDAVDKDGFTALHKAVIAKKEAVVSHLLRAGANLHVKDVDGATPLHYAVQVGAMQTVKLLIKYKVDVNVEDNEGWTPLHVAIQSRCRDIAKVLLVNGADKTRRNKDGKTPLDLSLCYGKDFKSYELAKLLKLVPANRDP